MVLSIFLAFIENCSSHFQQDTAEFKNCYYKRELLKKISIINIPPSTLSLQSVPYVFAVHFAHIPASSIIIVCRVIWQLYDERLFARPTFNVLSYHFGTRDSFQTLHNPQVTF